MPFPGAVALSAPGSITGGLQNYAALAQFDQAMRDMRARRIQEAAMGDYLQSLSAQGPQAPAPGQPSVRKTPPAIMGEGGPVPHATTPTTGTPSADTTATAAPPKQMSLDGLMSFLKDRGITGSDAYETAMQFQPWLKAQDAQKLGQMKFQVDMEKLLIAQGWDKIRAKDMAARVAAINERTRAMYGKGGRQDQIRSLDKTAQQLTAGRQKLQKQASDIHNKAQNEGRMLTPQEQATISQINNRIQTVDNGIQSVRNQQALLLGGQDYGQQDLMMAPDDSQSAADSVDVSDLGDSGDGGGQ